MNGMAEVVRQLSERLVQSGHDVTVATSAAAGRGEIDTRGVRVVEFPVSGNAVVGYCGAAASYQQFLLDSDFDVVVNFAAQQWATDLTLPLLSRIRGRKVLVPTGFSSLFSPSFHNYFEQMPGYMKLYDMNVFLSDEYRDITFARRHGVERLALIPNGAAADEFLEPLPDIRPQLGVAADEFLILHVGSHTWLKGHDDAMEIFRMADLTGATLLMVGMSLPGGCGAECRRRAARLNDSERMRRQGKRIMVVELSRRDTVAAYQCADLFLFPSNIECSPVVLFECMASRTPFLCTDAGNSAEIIRWSNGAGVLLPSARPALLPRHGGIVARIREKVRIMTGRSDDHAGVRAHGGGSARVLSEIYRDGERRRRMGEAGFDAWQERFTWEKIAKQYEELYRTLVAGGAP